jgi:hypothetical protein
MVIRIPSIMYGMTNAQEKATGEKDPSLTLGMTRQIRGDNINHSRIVMPNGARSCSKAKDRRNEASPIIILKLICLKILSLIIKFCHII